MPETSPWRCVHRSGSVTVGDFCCPHHDRGLSRAETASAYDIVVVRSGMFVKHVRGRSIVADANQVLFFNRGESYRVSHPVCTGDRCTTITLRESLLREAMKKRDPAAAEQDDALFGSANAPSDPRMFLEQSRLLRVLDGESLDPIAVEEIVFDLVDAALDRASLLSETGRRAHRRDTDHAHADLVEAVKLEMSRRLTPGASLDDFAASVHASPYHLSRVFKVRTGLSMHRYFNRLRVRAGLQMILDTRRDLTEIALECGYFDHSHFTNAFRREFGVSPSNIRGRGRSGSVK